MAVQGGIAVKPSAYGLAKALADDLALAAFLAACALCWCPHAHWPRLRTIYVSADGSDWRSGKSPDHALATIQRAADLARPGTVVVILPGVYKERVRIRTSGTRAEPITFRASEPGSVVLSGEPASRPVRGLKWQDQGSGIFSTKPPWPIYRIRAGGMEFLACESLAALKDLTARPNAWQAFHQSEDALYVYLPTDRRPSTVVLETHVPLPERLANGVWRAANVWVEGDHIRFEGLCFDFGVGYGIRIWDGADIRVRDCLFTGTERGVCALAGMKPTPNLHVENCLYHNYPQAEWRRTWMNKTELYRRTRCNGLLSSWSDGALIRSNLVVHASDGMYVGSDNVPTRSGADVHGNLIAFCTDDAIEFDGFAKKVHFHHNLIYDCHESLGTSPVLAGPTTIESNLFLHPYAGINGAQVKLMSPWLHRGPPLNGPIRNVAIFNNTFVGNWLCWYGRVPVEDVRIYQNVFAVRRENTPPWPPGVAHWNNRYVTLPESGYANPGKDKAWLTGLLPEGRGDKTTKADMEADYVGATPAGKHWRMARPGPRWLDWKTLPATSRLLDDLDRELFTE